MTKHTKGFTLIELLVGLTLFSMVLIVLYATLNFSIKSMAAGEKHLKEVRHVNAIHDFLLSKISKTKQINSQTAPNEPLFIGNKDTLQFVSIMPHSVHQGQSAVYTLGIKQGALNISFKPYDANLPTASHSQPVRMLGIKRIKLMYFGQPVGDKNSAWHSQWQQQSALPQLIKITLETESGLAWPAIAISLDINNIARQL